MAAETQDIGSLIKTNLGLLPWVFGIFTAAVVGYNTLQTVSAQSLANATQIAQLQQDKIQKDEQLKTINGKLDAILTKFELKYKPEKDQ